jgi:hypothetical protein
MLVKIGQHKYKIPNEHPYAEAIEALARAHALGVGNGSKLPERSDIKQLWPILRRDHRRLLTEIARRPGGVAQGELEKLLGVGWEKLRGIHNGLARICERVEVDKPVRTIGYNAENRRYDMPADVAATILKISKR